MTFSIFFLLFSHICPFLHFFFPSFSFIQYLYNFLYIYFFPFVFSFSLLLHICFTFLMIYLCFPSYFHIFFCFIIPFFQPFTSFSPYFKIIITPSGFFKIILIFYLLIADDSFNTKFYFLYWKNFFVLNNNWRCFGKYPVKNNLCKQTVIQD